MKTRLLKLSLFCLSFYLMTILLVVINMDSKEKKEKQIQLAKLFYEMGMEEDVILKISGIQKSEYLDLKNNENNFVDKEN